MATWNQAPPKQRNPKFQSSGEKRWPKCITTLVVAYTSRVWRFSSWPCTCWRQRQKSYRKSKAERENELQTPQSSTPTPTLSCPTTETSFWLLSSEVRLPQLQMKLSFHKCCLVLLRMSRQHGFLHPNRNIQLNLTMMQKVPASLSLLFLSTLTLYIPPGVLAQQIQHVITPWGFPPGWFYRLIATNKDFDSRYIILISRAPPSFYPLA